MKIWVDISNAPHVNFFKDFIDEWSIEHDVIVTTRVLSNTIDLLEKNNIEYNIVGSHYGKNKIAKLLGFFKRCNGLYSFLKHSNIDIAISQSSFYSPYVSKKLHIPCIYTNDNEFAKGNYIGFLLASHILLPEALEKWTKGRFFEKKVSFYPGVKEGIYIKQLSSKQENKQTVVYFRPEPWHAQYHQFKVTTFDKMLIKISKKNKIVILPRDKLQKSHFSNLSKKYVNIKVLENVKTVESIAEHCDIFLGAGGSMTREFALMGIPTISSYQGELLAVDKYLINYNAMIRVADLSKIDLDFIDLLRKNKSKNVELEGKGKKARELIHKLIANIDK